MFYKQLNGFRFIFVLMVMIQHWMPQWVYHYTHLGGIGVNLFFVLSGFLIGEILMREKEKTNSIAKSVKNFFMRRALRIFPVYYLTIAIYGVFFTTGGILIWNLTYTNNILECINVSRIPIEYSHLWSLCVEEQFYIFFPFLIFFTPRSKLKAVLIFAIVMSVLLRFGVTVAEYGDYNVIASRFTLMCVDCLFAGAFLAYLKTYRNETLVKIFNKKGLILPAIIVVAILHLVVRIYGTDLIYNTFFRFLSAMLGWLIIGYSVMVGFKGVLGRF
ncbi:MAG: acyltransferase, partial [Chitinophagaceae bacterium]|nr:acyltransferase [Chitinophagaceae bacterium]